MINNKKLDFAGIGAPKSGTSWVYQCLKEHPDICVSGKKEIHFFNEKHGFHRSSQEYNYCKGLNWYFSHFEHCKPGQLIGEMDTRYLYEKKALLLIKKHFPNIKIIINLRNPADRAYSNYSYHIQKYPEFKKIASNFEEAIKVESEFLELGKYYKHVKNCYEIFPKEKIFIIIFEDIKDNPKKVISNLYNFLGVDNNFIPECLNKKINKSTRNINLAHILKPINDLIKKNDIGKYIYFFMLRDGVKRFIQKKFVIKRKNRKINHHTKEFLIREVYQDDINKLSKKLNRDLHLWKIYN